MAAAGGILGNVSISTKLPDSDTLNVDDQGSGVFHTGKYAVTVTNTSITGLGRGTISYAANTLSSLSLEADQQVTVWNIQGTPIPYSYYESVGGKKGGSGGLFELVTDPTVTTIECNGLDTVNVGDPSNGMQDIFGSLNIYSRPGASGTLNVTLDDHETTYQSPQSIGVTNDRVTGFGPAVINYGFTFPDPISMEPVLVPGGVSELTVEAGTGGATFTVGDMTGGPQTVNLSALGTGNCIVSNATTAETWTFQGQGQANNPTPDSFTQGSSTSTVNFEGLQAITGGTGENDFQFIQTGFAGTIDGGSGGNSALDFRRYGGSSLNVELTLDGSLNGVQGTATEGTTFDNIDTLIGDQSADWYFGNTTAQNGTYQGNFTHTLTVAGFANMDLNVAGDFSGELLASTEGTAANPISQINVAGTVEAGAMIKVKFLFGLDVEGDMDGVVKAFGDDPLVASIQYIVVDGTVGSGAQIVAKIFSSVEVQQDFAGILSETNPTADFQSLTIGGSFLPSGLIDAASGGTLSVAGDFSGEAVIAGALGTLSVGGTLDGIVSADSYGNEDLGGPVTGQIDTGLTTAPPINIAAGDVAGLIQAIDEANLIALPSIINLAPGSTYILTTPDNDTYGPTGLPVISSNITINGNGAVIERTGSTPLRIFYVSSGATVVLNDLTIEQGSSTSGGGVYNAGTLTLNNDILTGNSAAADGGAVYNGGALTVNNTTFSNNSAGGSGPDVFNAVATTPTTTTLTDNGPNSSTFGQTVNFTVNVSGGVPDGEQVTLEDASNGNLVVGAGAVTGGTANIAVTNLGGGAHDIFATYGGDSTLTGSQSSTVTQTIYQSPNFTSAPDVTFAVGSSSSFTVTAGGYLTPTLSEDSDDVLPSGVTFDPSTCILSGTPALGAEGVYTLNFAADNGIGAVASQTFTLTVGEATPVITWNIPNPITYGTPLDNTELDATANVPGTFVYSQVVGAVLPAVDTPLLAVTFTPTDTTNYATVTQVVALEVDPAPLTVYADPQTMTYGSAVPALTFTATGFVNGDTAASLPGSLATAATSSSPVGSYDITLGTLGISDANASGFNSNYDITYYDASLTVSQAAPLISWATPSEISNETPLDVAQLNATATVSGTFVYSPAAGTVLPTGTQTLNVTFTPDDAVDYSTANASVQLTVADAAAPAVTSQPSDLTVNAGGTATFTAVASGGPTPTVQWQVNAGSGFADVPTGGAYSVDATGNLTITGVTNYLNGDEFRAVFTNSWDSVTTNAARLNVIPDATSTSFVDYGPNSSTTANSIDLTVTVSGGVPGGELVAIEDASNGDAVVATTGNTLTDGSATLTVPAGALSVGTHNLFAIYGGDGMFGGSLSTTLTQVVNAAPAITTTPLDNWTLDVAGYNQTVAATGGAGTLTWSLQSGDSLPAGLSLSTPTGAITGKPTALGTYIFHVVVTDSIGDTATEAYSVSIASPLTISANGFTTSVLSEYSGLVAVVYDSSNQTQLANLTATINWGDGTQTTGSITTNNNGTFYIYGSHSYSTVGAYTVTVTVKDVTNPLSAVSTSSTTEAYSLYAPDAYIYAYYGYVYAYDAYVNGGSYAAYLYSYYAFVYAFDAYYFDQVGNVSDSQYYAYYAYIYGYYGAYYAYVDYVNSAGTNVYSYDSYYFGSYGWIYSYYTAAGY